MSPSARALPRALLMADYLHWVRFRSEFAAALTARLPVTQPARSVDLQALARAFWAWAAVLEHDTSFEALDPVDYAHFAAGQLLARLLMNRPVVAPPLPPEAEAGVLIEAVVDQLRCWRSARAAPPLDDRPIDTGSLQWASFLENTAAEPELAIAFLDDFTGLEPAWRYPQLISERPAMQKARRTAPT